MAHGAKKKKGTESNIQRHRPTDIYIYRYIKREREKERERERTKEREKERKRETSARKTSTKRVKDQKGSARSHSVKNPNSGCVLSSAGGNDTLEYSIAKRERAKKRERKKR